MADVRQLQCRECARTYDVAPIYVCEFCFAPLEPVYDYEDIRSKISRDSISRGPLSIWRYRELLPEVGEGAVIDLGAGFTPLLKARRLAEALGLENLYLKNDTANPTHSFKDRVVSVALSVAQSMGFKTVACASTGNLANAVAAHAARAGLESYVFIPSDLERGKIVTTAVYGGNIVAVDGNYDQVNRLCSEIAQTVDWAFVNVNIRPFYSEGSKTLAFEITEQLGWKPPDHVIVPVASGSLLTKILKGLNEMHETGLVEDKPTTRIHAAQADGCAPVVTALSAGVSHVKPVKPQGIAKSLAIGNPADGHYAVDAVRKTGGVGEAVTDDEIVEGMLLLASTEGIFTETAGGVTVAALKKMAAAGVFDSSETVVALITGMGLKTADVLGPQIGPTMVIPPNIDAFREEMRT